MINSKKTTAFFYFSERQELQQRSDDLRKEVTARITLYKPQGKYRFIEEILTYHPKQILSKGADEGNSNGCASEMYTEMVNFSRASYHRHLFQQAFVDSCKAKKKRSL